MTPHFFHIECLAIPDARSYTHTYDSFFYVSLQPSRDLQALTGLRLIELLSFAIMVVGGKKPGKTTTAKHKGGHRNYKKGSVDIDHLADKLKTFVKAVGCRNPFDFGEYNNM